MLDTRAPCNDFFLYLAVTQMRETRIAPRSFFIPFPCSRNCNSNIGLGRISILCQRTLSRIWNRRLCHQIEPWKFSSQNFLYYYHRSKIIWFLDISFLFLLAIYPPILTKELKDNCFRVIIQIDKFRKFRVCEWNVLYTLGMCICLSWIHTYLVSHCCLSRTFCCVSMTIGQSFDRLIAAW